MPINVKSRLVDLLTRATANDFPDGSPFGSRDGQPFVKFNKLEVQCVNGEARVTLRYMGDEVITFTGDSADGQTTHFEGLSGTINYTLS